MLRWTTNTAAVAFRLKLCDIPKTLEKALLVAENLEKEEREIEKRVRAGADLADLMRYDELLKAESLAANAI